MVAGPPTRAHALCSRRPVLADNRPLPSVSATVAQPSSALTIGGSLAAALVLVVLPVIAILSVLIGQHTCAGAAAGSTPTAAADRGIPPRYLALYRQAGERYTVPWPVLAAIGSIETDQGHHV